MILTEDEARVEAWQPVPDEDAAPAPVRNLLESALRVRNTILLAGSLDGRQANMRRPAADEAAGPVEVAERQPLAWPPLRDVAMHRLEAKVDALAAPRPERKLGELEVQVLKDEMGAISKFIIKPRAPNGQR